MKKLLIFLPFFLLAHEHSDISIAHSDFLPRLVNALIFFGILFYFLKNPIKKAYNDRINNIVSKLEKIEKRLRESKEKKENSVKELELAKNRAANLVEVSKKEAVLLTQKLKDSAELEIANLEKNYESQKEFEKRKMKKSVTKEILDEIFSDDSISLSEKELVNIVQKKVS